MIVAAAIVWIGFFVALVTCLAIAEHHDNNRK